MKQKTSLFWILLLLCSVIHLTAASPKIDYIETFLSTQVLIHFDTDANLNYELQYTETLTNGVPGGTWTNLFTAPSIPFPNHYIVPDTRMRPMRFYRLRVFP